MNAEQVFVKMVLDRWYAQVKQFNEMLDKLTDEQLQQEIAPGRNRGIYLVGHLTAVHDDMLPLLRFENKNYPELIHAFLESPDKTVPSLPPATELRTAWKNINDTLKKHFDSLTPAQWFERHNSISPEDFVNEPHRNRLNVVIGRISHLAWHAGQVAWLK